MRLIPLIIFVAGLMLSGMAPAAESDPTNPDYENAKMGIDNKFKADQERCAKLDGNAKSVCEEKAGQTAKAAQEQLDAKRKGDVDSHINASETRVDSQYSVDKVRCDALDGNSKTLCLESAKAKHDKAQADIGLGKETYDAKQTADAKKRKANYDLAVKKCESLAAETKDSCIAQAKKRWSSN